MKTSVRLRLMALLALFTLGIVSLYLLLNTLFYERFYLNEKKQYLIGTYQGIDQLYKAGGAGIASQLERLDINRSLNITILNGDAPVYGRFPWQRPRRGFPVPRAELHERLLYRAPDGRCSITVRYDDSLQAHHIELDGLLENGYRLFLRTPMESVRESVGASNRFILLVGAATILLGSMIIFFLANRFTRPLLRLSAMADQLAHLNFDVEYETARKDEIGLLAGNIHLLATRLERTISELKTANARLTKDIENKTKIDRMRREFLSNVSHELKTPIALIHGYAEGLRDGVADDEQSRAFYCDVILDESEKMGVLIQKLMTLMQIESGEDPIAIRRFDIVAMLRGMLSSGGLMYRQKGVQPVLRSPESVFVWGDEFLIEDVLRNYLLNALNHVDDEKSIVLTVRRDGDEVYISVFNSGEHIPEDEKENIWRSFYKIDKARSRAYGGSGIGLAVVAAIMNASGRPYGVKNVWGGCEFYIVLDSA